MEVTKPVSCSVSLLATGLSSSTGGVGGGSFTQKGSSLGEQAPSLQITVFYGVTLLQKHFKWPEISTRSQNNRVWETQDGFKEKIHCIIRGFYRS